MTALTEFGVDFSDYRTHIAAALVHAGDTHSVDDVAAMIAAGHAQFWPGPASCVVTQVIVDPKITSLHFFLAAGVLRELRAMTPHILDWGRMQGCTKATLCGRKGWARSFLTARGWTVSPLILMETSL